IFITGIVGQIPFSGTCRVYDRETTARLFVLIKTPTTCKKPTFHKILPCIYAFTDKLNEFVKLAKCSLTKELHTREPHENPTVIA
ncbi:hypothetical protein L9F63_009491, partial [Diploptera punctata]